MGKKKTAIIDDSKVEEVKKDNSSENKSAKKAKKTEREAKQRGKKYQEARARIDKNKLYNISEAIKLVRETNYSKFDGSVELHVVVKKTGLSENLKLPHGTGKEKKVEVANEKTLKKLEDGNIDFDVLLATPEMMPKLARFGQVLGPRGLMPNPKNNTLIKSEADAKNFSTDSINLKTEKKQPVVHTLAGNLKMDDQKLEENIMAVINKIGPKQVVKAYVCSSMSPSVKLQVD